MANVTAQEQLMLELVNRARLDPLAEAALFGIDLNEGLAPGTIAATQKQALAMNDLLVASSHSHSQWMLANNVFQHAGPGGNTWHDRMTAAGYQFTGAWTSGENLSWYGIFPGPVDPSVAIVQQHEDLFRSKSHRVNLMGENYREIGIGQDFGTFNQNGTAFASAMVTQNFARTGTNVFITGIVYNDLDSDRKYAIGEGIGGAVLTATGGATDTTGTAGGYEISVAAGARVVSFGPVTVGFNVGTSNIKLDIASTNHVLTDTTVTSYSGAVSVTLLGFNNVGISGGTTGATLLGNRGNNIIVGSSSDDIIYGMDGDDTIGGGTGNNVIDGGIGNDTGSYAGFASTSFTYAAFKGGIGISGNSRSDSWRNVETFTFSDGTFTFNDLLNRALAAPGSVSIADAQVFEGNAGTKVMTFVVTRSGGLGAFSVDFATLDGTAISGADYAAANGTLSFAQNELTKVVSVTISGDLTREQNETFGVRLSNGTNAVVISDADAVGTITNDDANSAPVVTAQNIVLTRTNTNPAVAKLMSANDVDGDAITGWQFWDNTAGGGNFVVNGIDRASLSLIDVSAADFGATTFRAGAGIDSLWVRATDGAIFGAWVNFSVSGPMNALPVVNAPNAVLVRGNLNPALSTLVSATDGDSDAITAWQFWDVTPGAGGVTKGGVVQPAASLIDMTAAEFAAATFRGGMGVENIWVRANDGFVWGDWKNFTVSPPDNAVPVVTAPNTVLTRGNLNPALNSLVSATDANGDAITAWQFWDVTPGSGGVMKGGVLQPHSSLVELTAGEFATATFQGSGAVENIWVRANDGFVWGDWKNFTVSPPDNAVPVVTAPNTVLTRGNLNPALNTLISATDANGDTVQTWQFWDATPGGGSFMKGGVAQPASSLIEMSAAEFAAASFQGAGGTDSLWLRAYDGFGWSTWQNFTVSGPANTAPVVNTANAQFNGAGVVRNVSDIFSATDANADAVTQWQFWDHTLGGGGFSVGGTPKAARTVVEMTAGEFATATFTSGASDDDVWARAYDGLAWGDWKYVRMDNLLA